MAVLDVVRPFLEIFIGKDNATDHIVRKLAHFTEFGALGVELIAYIAEQKRVKLQSIVNCMFFGLSVAVIDETIQIFANRGSQVQGYTVGRCRLLRWNDFSVDNGINCHFKKATEIKKYIIHVVLKTKGTCAKQNLT